jgi:predicted ATPase
MHLRSVTCHPERYPTREHYPFNLPIFQRPTELTFDTPVTIFVGENGTGKSTLLEALVHKCGIHVWRDETRHRVENNPYEDKFPEHISIEWTDGRVPGSFFSASVFQDFAEILDDWAAVDPGQLKHFGGRSLVTQSHGQSIMSYLSARYKIKGLYLLDEPEAALSPKTQIELLKVFESMSAAGHAQFIIATHSPILLSCPGATIYSFDRMPIAPVSYRETDHYRIYRQFLGEK